MKKIVIAPNAAIAAKFAADFGGVAIYGVSQESDQDMIRLFETTNDILVVPKGIGSGYNVEVNEVAFYFLDEGSWAVDDPHRKLLLPYIRRNPKLGLATKTCESCDGTGHDLYGGTLNPITFNLGDCTVCNGEGHIKN